MSKESKIKISMFSSAERIKGQGVASAYREQVNLIENLSAYFQVFYNKLIDIDIAHYHTIDLKYYLSIPFLKKQGVAVGYVHFIPETIEGSLQLPAIIKAVFYRYIIHFYKRMDYLVTVNPYFIDKLVSYGIPEQKIVFIPNYVSSKDFYPLSAREIQQERLANDISQDKFVVLGVGQVQLRKGVLDFIEVARRLPELQFIWAGGFSFGKISAGYQKLKAIVADPPVNVKFLGIVPRDSMSQLYNLADLFFLPSYNELFPMSILEAMACHKPLLLRDIQLYENILQGYYLAGGGIEDFVSEIQKLKSKEKYYQEAEQLSQKGSQYYSREYVLSLWQDFYQSIYQAKVVER